MLTTVDSLLAALLATAPLLCTLSFYPLMTSAYSWLLLTHGFSFPPLLRVSLGDFPSPNKEELIGRSVTDTSIRHDHDTAMALLIKRAPQNKYQSQVDSSLGQLG